MAKIRVPPSVLDEIEDLQPDHREHVKERLKKAGEDPEHYLKPLTGYNYHRLRAGDYRVVVGWDREEDIIYALYFDKRDDDTYTDEELSRLPDVDEL
jgi:mRNA interferase RelE/StbE